MPEENSTITEPIARQSGRGSPDQFQKDDLATVKRKPRPKSSYMSTKVKNRHKSTRNSVQASVDAGRRISERKSSDVPGNKLQNSRPLSSNHR